MELRNFIALELVQGERRQILLEQRARFHRIRAIDPRIFRYELAVAVR